VTRFLSLDIKTRNVLFQKILDASGPIVANQVISFCEEMEPVQVEEFIVRLLEKIDAKGVQAQALRAVLDALRNGKAKGGDWRLAPRTSRKQVANADRRIK
jgi:hypothetical protein